jgi:hypothetical protein
LHHSLGLYGQNQHRLIHLYINLARLTSLPVVGWLVRQLANLYARTGHSGYYLSLSEAEQIIDSADSVAIGPCSCREVFKNCDYPVMSEIVLGKGGRALYSTRTQEFHQISPEDAKKVLRQAHSSRLTQSIMRCGSYYYAICNCCPCCCVPTRLKNQFGIGRALVRNQNVVNDFQRQKLR